MTVSCMLAPVDRDRLAQAAALAGLTFSAYCRALLSGRRLPAARDNRRDLARILAALGRPGSNLNQIARVLNGGGALPPAALGILAEAGQEIAALRVLLLEALR